MKTFASTLLAAAFTVALASAASACPAQDKQASLTNGNSYQTAENQKK